MRPLALADEPTLGLVVILVAGLLMLGLGWLLWGRHQ
jgi:hypothetical protein